MEIDWVKVAGLTASVFLTLVFSMLVILYEFPAFDYSMPSPELVDVSTSIGLGVSKFLWSYRLIDLIAQAFVLFAAAACCVVVLRTREKGK